MAEIISGCSCMDKSRQVRSHDFYGEEDVIETPGMCDCARVLRDGMVRERPGGKLMENGKVKKPSSCIV